MNNDKLVNLSGSIEDVLKDIDPTTIQSANDIIFEKMNNNSLDNLSFIVSNFVMYRIEQDRFTGDYETVIYLTNGEDNPLFNNGLHKKLSKNAPYSCEVPQDMIQSILAKEKGGLVLRLPIKSLNLRANLLPQSSFYMYTQPKKNNDSQNEFGKFLCGKDNFLDYLNFLNKKGIKKVKHWVLKPKYLLKHLTVEKSLGVLCNLDLSEVRNDLFNADGYFSIPDSSFRAEPRPYKKITLDEKKLYTLLDKYVAPSIVKDLKDDLRKLYK
jgi:hypothetical protein